MLLIFRMYLLLCVEGAVVCARVYAHGMELLGGWTTVEVR